MPKQGYIQTKEHRLKISLAKMGNTNRSCKKQTKETKNKISLSKKGKNMGDKHHNWKGEDALYRAKHMWIESVMGKPHHCQICKNENLKHRQYNWANISGQYKRKLNDWIRLCSKCHKAFDTGKIQI